MTLNPSWSELPVAAVTGLAGPTVSVVPGGDLQWTELAISVLRSVPMPVHSVTPPALRGIAGGCCRLSDRETSGCKWRGGGAVER